MHTFLDNFHQCRKYYDQIASHQAELKREEIFADQKYLSISFLQTDYLNLDSSSVFEEILKEQTLIIQSEPFAEVLTTM